MWFTFHPLKAELTQFLMTGKRTRVSLGHPDLLSHSSLEFGFAWMFSFSFEVPGMEPRVLGMVGKCSLCLSHTFCTSGFYISN